MNTWEMDEIMCWLLVNSNLWTRCSFWREVGVDLEVIWSYKLFLFEQQLMISITIL